MQAYCGAAFFHLLVSLSIFIAVSFGMISLGRYARGRYDSNGSKRKSSLICTDIEEVCSTAYALRMLFHYEASHIKMPFWGCICRRMHVSH